MTTAARIGAVADLDDLSMTRPFDALASRHASGFDGLGMSINVSAAVLAAPGYPDLLNRTIRATGSSSAASSACAAFCAWLWSPRASRPPDSCRCGAPPGAL